MATHMHAQALLSNNKAMGALKSSILEGLAASAAAQDGQAVEAGASASAPAQQQQQQQKPADRKTGQPGAKAGAAEQAKGSQQKGQSQKDGQGQKDGKGQKEKPGQKEKKKTGVGVPNSVFTTAAVVLKEGKDALFKSGALRNEAGALLWSSSLFGQGCVAEASPGRIAALFPCMHAHAAHAAPCHEMPGERVVQQHAPPHLHAQAVRLTATITNALSCSPKRRLAHGVQRGHGAGGPRAGQAASGHGGPCGSV